MTAGTIISQHVIDPRLHFPGCLIGKGDGQDMIGFYPFLFDQIGNAHR